MTKTGATKRVWPIRIFAFVANAAMVVLPFLPGPFNVIFGDQDRLPVIVGMLGAGFSILTILVASEMAEYRHLMDAAQANLQASIVQSNGKIIEQINGARIRMLRDDSFHADFLAAAKQARHSVLISYFAPNPPNPLEAWKEKYYRDMISVIKSSPHVRFVRIIRQTRSNEIWARELAEKLRGSSNADIYLLPDSHAEREMTTMVSCQFVDDESVWFVAVSSHVRKEEYRDCRLDSAEFSRYMRPYYDRLTELSVPVLRQGMIR